MIRFLGIRNILLKRRYLKYLTTDENKNERLPKGPKKIIINKEGLVSNNVRGEIRSLFHRLKLDQNLIENYIFNDISISNDKNNAISSCIGYLITKRLVTNLIEFHYQKQLPTFLISYFTDYLVSADMIGKMCDAFGISDVIQAKIDQNVNEMADPVAKKVKIFAHERVKTRSYSNHAAFFSLLQVIHDFKDPFTVYKLLDNILIPQLANLPIENIPENHLPNLINQILKVQGKPEFFVFYTKFMNEVIFGSFQTLIHGPETFNINILSGDNLLSSSYDCNYSKSLHSAKLGALSSLINSLYVEEIDFQTLDG